ncbi:MAG: hypothetical protein JNK17_01600 [Hydrogenophaga sp.]|nr:hypothetical protein [Hydrogenophaga sp.]
MRLSPTSFEQWPLRLTKAVLFGVGLLLAVRLLGLGWLMSVNVPFSDQWAILRALEDGFQWGDVLTAFRWQHGPHRQGLSFAFMLPAYHFSHWSVRLDSMLMVAEQLLAGAMMLRLRRQLVPGPWRLWDAILLLLFWSVCTFETMVVAPNASHSIFPLLLLMVLANAWVLPVGRGRFVALAALILFLTFTGFGITAIGPVAAVLVLQVWRCHGVERRHAAGLLGVCALALALFLQDYHFVVAADGFEAMRPNPFDYVHFMVAMFSHFLLMLHRASRWVLYPVGALAMAGMVLVALWAMRALTVDQGTSVAPPTRRRLAEVCLILIGASLAFALLTAYGRVQLGVAAATASRYTALLMPGIGALVLMLMQVPQRWSASLLLALLLLFAARTVPETRQAWLQSRYYASMKLCWFERYQVTRDFDAASEQAKTLDGFGTFQPVWMGEPGTWQMLAEQGEGPFAPGAADVPFLRIYPRPCEVLQAP